MQLTDWACSVAALPSIKVCFWFIWQMSHSVAFAGVCAHVWCPWQPVYQRCQCHTFNGPSLTSGVRTWARLWHWGRLQPDRGQGGNGFSLWSRPIICCSFSVSCVSHVQDALLCEEGATSTLWRKEGTIGARKLNCTFVFSFADIFWETFSHLLTITPHLK